ncbi:MAG: PAS domain S-box protein, partial [Sulfurimonas sp.]
MFVNIDNKETFFAYLDNLPVAIVVADTSSGEVVFFSKEAERLWQKKADEVVGKKQTILHPEYWNDRHRETFSKDIAILRSGKVVKNTQNAILCGNGDEIPVDIYANLVHFEGKEYIVGVFISIEQRVRALGELQQQ